MPVNDFVMEVGLLSPEEAGVETPIDKNKLPGAVEPPVKEVVTETPEEKEAKDKAEKERLEKKKQENLNTPAILTPEEAGVELPKETTTPTDIDSVIDYKALVQAKIDKGDWKKWDNWDEIKDETEITPELYLQLENEQFQAKIEETLAEREASLPKRVQEITKYIQNGGREEDLYASYQQEVEVNSFDPTNPEDAESLIEAHCNAMDWSDERTAEYIESLKDKGVDRLTKVATEAKEALVKVVEEERAETLKAQEEVARKNRDYWATFNKNFRNSVYKEEGVPDKEKKEIERFVYELKYEDKQGNKFSELAKVYDEIIHDPVKYHKYVKMLKNFDKYEDKTKTEKEVNKKTLNFLRSGQQDLGKNSTQSPEVTRDKKPKVQYNPFASLSGS